MNTLDFFIGFICGVIFSLIGYLLGENDRKRNSPSSKKGIGDGTIPNNSPIPKLNKKRSKGVGK